MSFETKKIIDDTPSLTQNFLLLVRHMWLFVGMFCVGVLMVFLWVKGYGIIQQDTTVRLFGTGIGALPVKPSQNIIDNKKIVNALIIWVWWKWHRGAYNTDTMIVVSYNPITKQINMISLPRDLYVNIDKWYYGRINSILEYYFSSKGYTIDQSLDILKTKVWNLIGQDIAYYWMIDFQGFENIIDTLGGVKVNVPEELYDPAFPIDNFNYGTLNIASGVQTMDGNTALNYARSRHSTSDFDRSRRQQIIIKAVLDKLLSLGSLTKMKSLYADFQDTVTTNVGASDMVRYLPYLTKIDNLNSVVFQSDCPENLNQMRHGCVLYSPPRESFGGAAVLLPYGATPTSVSNYTELFTFVNRIIYYPFGQFEDIKLAIYNGIHQAVVAKSIAGFSTKLWVELIRNGLDVEDVSNNQTKHTGTMMVLLTWTVLSQKQFASYNALVQDILDIGDIQIIWKNQLPAYFSGEIETGVNVMLLVGSDALTIQKPIGQ